MPMPLFKKFVSLLLGASILAPLPALAVAPPEMKQEAVANVDSHAKLVQVMVDTGRVAGGEDAAQDGHAQGPADLAGGVVDSRAHAGLLLGE